MPPQLMELMRHESIETTLRFYVGQNAQKTSAILWEAHKAEKSGAVNIYLEQEDTPTGHPLQ